MPTKKLLTTIMAVLTLLAVAGGFTSFQRKRSSFERLDFQFHWNRGVIIVDGVDESSRAEKAGLRAGDQIWVVGGTPASEVEGLKKTLRRVGPVDLVIARGNQTVTLHYEAPGLKIDYRYLFLSFIGFLYLAIGLFTFFRGSGNESTLFYLLTLLAFIVYVYTPAGAVDTTYKTLFMIEELARIFLPAVALHFFLHFPRPLLSRRRMVGLLYVLPLLLTAWATNVYLFDNRIELASPARSMSLIDRFEMLDFALYFSLAFIALTYTYRTSSAAGQKKQIKWIYLGVAVGFIPFLILYLVPFILSGVDSAYTTAAILPLALIPLAFALSILKYKLWDVEVVIKEVLAYTVTFVFGMIAFSTINLLLSQMIEEHLTLERNFLSFASGLMIAAVLVPVKSRVESLLDMVLYRDTYRHRKAAVDFAYELATFHDLNELLDSLRGRISAAIQVQRLNLYVRDGASLVVYSQEPGIPNQVREDSFGSLSAAAPFVFAEPRLPGGTVVPDSLFRAGYRYAFPLRYRNQLEGVLICGARRNEEPLSRDDIHLINSLTAPVALAIENARLYSRLRRQLVEISSLKEYNENIIESSSSAIVVVSADGTILTANRAFWDLIALGPDNNLDIDELFPPYKQLRAAGASAMELSFVNRRGEEKQLSIKASPFSSADAPEGTSVVVIADISERVRLERELLEKDRLASLGLLAAGVAHEVNTPLTGISSYAQLLLKELPPTDPRHSILKKMEEQTFRASRIVNNLLDFAANRHRPTEQVSLRSMVLATVSLHEDLLRVKDIQTHVASFEDVVVPGNYYELQQVLTNLILNARDAVGRGGNIWIDVHRTSDSAILSVRDDGKGVPPEMQEAIFKPLVTSKRGQGGTGLGLAISERIVKSLGGRISVESAEGSGATFSVVLPLEK